MNTGNTYYFVDDFNNICKQENGMKKEESIVLSLEGLIDDVNNIVEENEQLKNEIEKLKISRPIEKCKEAKNMECINCSYINKCDYFKNRMMGK